MGTLLSTVPKWIGESLHYLVVSGSHAYGVAQEHSDRDLYGVCIPPKEIVFPHLAGVIPGFGDQGQRFEQFVTQGDDCDVAVYSIVRYFKLCAECNPNLIDSLFVPEDCILQITNVGRLIRDNRHMFLSKMAWPRFKGYAYEQARKLANKRPQGKRKALVDQYGYDTKFAYHIVRLLSEVEQIIGAGELDLRRDRDILMAVRRGEWTLDEINAHFDDTLVALKDSYARCKLPDRPDEAALKRLLMECLEAHYGGCESDEDRR